MLDREWRGEGEGMRLEPILIALIWLNKDMTKMVYLDATTLILLLLASTLWISECSTEPMLSENPVD